MSLILFEQIKNGKQLVNDLNAIKQSYQAVKVLTDISKGEGNYNVNELLTVLKTKVDSLGDTEGGTIVDLINKSEEKTKGLIEAVSKATIKDRVRVKATLTTNGEGVPTLVVKPEHAELLDKVEKSIDYTIYRSDKGTPILAMSGGALTYNFGTQTVTGVAAQSIFDEEKSAKALHVLANANLEVDLFVVADFAFGELLAKNSGFLLDNEEYKSIAYAEAIQDLSSELSQNTELLDAVKALIGEEAVKTQLDKLKSNLEAQINAVKTKVETLEGNDQVVGSVDNKVKVAKEALTAEIHRLESLITEKDTTAKVAKLEKDVQAITNPGGTIDTKVNAAKEELTSKITAVENGINGKIDAKLNPVKQDVETLKGGKEVSGSVDNKIDTAKKELQASVASVSGEVETLKGRVQTTESDIAQAKLDITGLKEKATTAEQGISSLQAKVTALEAKAVVIEDVESVSGSQTQFALTKVPNSVPVQMFVCGIRHKEGKSFTVDRAERRVTWNPSQAGHEITADMDVSFVYYI